MLNGFFSAADGAGVLMGVCTFDSGPVTPGMLNGFFSAADGAGVLMGVGIFDRRSSSPGMLNGFFSAADGAGALMSVCTFDSSPAITPGMIFLVLFRAALRISAGIPVGFFPESEIFRKDVVIRIRFAVWLAANFT